MGVGQIIKIVGVVVAIVAGLWTDMPYAAMAIAVLGVIGAYFIDAEDRMRVLVAAIALGAGVGAGADAIPAIGPILTSVMASLGALYAAASVTCILMTIYEKLKP